MEGLKEDRSLSLKKRKKKCMLWSLNNNNYTKY